MLQTSPEVVHARMLDRGCLEESGIPLDYLKKVCGLVWCGGDKVCGVV